MAVVIMVIDIDVRWLRGLRRYCVAVMTGWMNLLFPYFTLRELNFGCVLKEDYR